MKIKLKVEKEFDAKYLQAEVGARYWEDATVNGVEDELGDLIPCRDGDYWKPLIELETGKIVNWEQGKTANIHYKSCDDNTFKLLDEKHEVIKSVDGYVISGMAINDNGYGDYVIMEVDAFGNIKDWEADLSDFEDEEN